MIRFLRKSFKNLNREDGQSTAEYVLILAIVVMLVLKFKSVFVPEIDRATQGVGKGINSIIQDMESSDY